MTARDAFLAPGSCDKAVRGEPLLRLPATEGKPLPRESAPIEMSCGIPCRSGGAWPVEFNLQHGQPRIITVAMPDDSDAGLRVARADCSCRRRVFSAPRLARPVSVVPLAEDVEAELDLAGHRDSSRRPWPEHIARPGLEGSEEALDLAVEVAAARCRSLRV